MFIRFRAFWVDIEIRIELMVKRSFFVVVRWWYSFFSSSVEKTKGKIGKGEIQKGEKTLIIIHWWWSTWKQKIANKLPKYTFGWWSSSNDDGRPKVNEVKEEKEKFSMVADHHYNHHHHRWWSSWLVIVSVYIACVLSFLWKTTLNSVCVFWCSIKIK